MGFSKNNSKTSTRKIKVYRKRVKKSVCRKSHKNRRSCVSKPICKFATGKKRRFCRRRTNKRVR
jgi:hypothetical protein